LDVAFDGSASTDPDGTIVSWGWDFGDGGSGAGATTLHSFAASGTYTVVLTVTDDEGLTGSATVDIVVVEPGSDGPFLESGGLAVFEAEHFHANIIRGDHEWVEDVANAGFSGESAMKTSPDTGLQVKTNATTTSPELSFNVDFSTTGDYYVWGRVWAPNKNGNSIYIGFDGALGSNNDIFQTSTYGSWVWVEFQSNSATVPHAIAAAGLHTVHAWLRKDGMLLDKVVMTKDPDFTPTGTGPAESPRGPSAPDWAAAGQRAIRGDNPLTLATVAQEMPDAFSLDGNYPNPFNPSTTLRYALPHEAHVRLAIYDTMGRQVAVVVDRVESAGRYEVQWNGRASNGAPVASGVYLVQMQAGTFNATHTLLLAK
jgi:PKD repeat protein